LQRAILFKLPMEIFTMFAAPSTEINSVSHQNFGKFIKFSLKTSNFNPMAQQFIKDNIAKQRVVIFSKSYCPYCTMAKEVRKYEKTKETSIVTHEICFVAIQKDQL
jgi:hypothetical protein